MIIELTSNQVVAVIFGMYTACIEELAKLGGT